METIKEGMTLLLRKLHDLQMWLYSIDSVVKLEIYTSPQDEGYIYGLAFCDENISKANFFGGFSNNYSFKENKKELDSFVEQVIKLEYECRKINANLKGEGINGIQKTLSVGKIMPTCAL